MKLSLDSNLEDNNILTDEEIEEYVKEFRIRLEQRNVIIRDHIKSIEGQEQK